MVNLWITYGYGWDTLWFNQTWLENPWIELSFFIGKSLRNGPFSRKPCVITTGYPLWTYHTYYACWVSYSQHLLLDLIARHLKKSLGPRGRSQLSKTWDQSPINMSWTKKRVCHANEVSLIWTDRFSFLHDLEKNIEKTSNKSIFKRCLHFKLRTIFSVARFAHACAGFALWSSRRQGFQCRCLSRACWVRRHPPLRRRRRPEKNTAKNDGWNDGETPTNMGWYWIVDIIYISPIYKDWDVFFVEAINNINVVDRYIETLRPHFLEVVLLIWDTVTLICHVSSMLFNVQYGNQFDTNIFNKQTFDWDLLKWGLSS